MTNEQWDNCQKLIESGLSDIVMDDLKHELTSSLSEKQLAPLGDLDTTIRNLFTADMTIEKAIKATIQFARDGVIIRVKDNNQSL